MSSACVAGARKKPLRVYRLPARLRQKTCHGTDGRVAARNDSVHSPRASLRSDHAHTRRQQNESFANSHSGYPTLAKCCAESSLQHATACCRHRRPANTGTASACSDHATPEDPASAHRTISESWFATENRRANTQGELRALAF